MLFGFLLYPPCITVFFWCFFFYKRGDVGRRHMRSLSSLFQHSCSGYEGDETLKYKKRSVVREMGLA